MTSNMANHSELVWIVSLVHLRFVKCNLRLNVNLNMLSKGFGLRHFHIEKGMLKESLNVK